MPKPPARLAAHRTPVVGLINAFTEDPPDCFVLR